MKVVSIYSRLLAPRISQVLGCEFVRPTYRMFEDSESSFKIDKTVEGNVIIIDSTYPEQDRRLNEIRRLADLLKRTGTKSVGAIVPYLAYQRQDKDFSNIDRNGYESITAVNVVRDLERDLDFFYTVDVHSKRALANSYKYRGDIDPTPAFVSYLSKFDLNSSVLVAPDDNAQNKINKMAKSLKMDLLFLEKQRDVETGKITMKSESTPLPYHSATIVDDIIASGGTIIEAAQILKSRGISNIRTIVTHAQMLGDAENKMKNARIGVVSTDSIENNYSQISLANVIVARLFDDKII